MQIRLDVITVKKTIRYLAIICLLSMIVSMMPACGSVKTPPVRNLKWAVGGTLPSAEDFFETMPKGCSARFDREYTFSSLGDYTLTVIYKNAQGREKEIKVNFTLGVDETPPKIEGEKDISVFLGEGVSYRDHVKTSDDFDGPVTVSVDSSAVNLSKEGNYPVIYTATDTAGNKSTLQVMVWVYRESVTEEMLWEKVDQIISEHISKGVSKEQQAREVFDFVYYTIRYDSYSDKNDWVRAAYDGLKNERGDCYTYFAVSKALLTRLGIENMDVKRTAGIVDERHYWSLVNIGTSDAPKWYHFDACNLSGASFKGCLLTDRQIAAYTAKRVDENDVGNYFYAYDSTSYPPRATQTITDPYET